MNKINFNGINGIVTESSPHGNYLVVQLSNRISICGTFLNMWNWEESPDLSSGFKSFITYIGFNGDRIQQKYLELINEMGGYVRDNELKREKMRVRGKFRYEMKVRNLEADHVLDLIATQI